MKAVSAVIAVVLILMITVALAAAAYVWFSDVFGSITKGVGKAAEGVSEKIATDFDIEVATYNSDKGQISVTIRNIGTTDIDLTKIAMYIDGEITDFNLPVDEETEEKITSIRAGEVATLTTDYEGCTGTHTIKLTTETGLDKSETLECPEAGV
ncbi:MAG: hypothetical protein J7K26_03805 [Candidatus Aenigmarchaeota archaeon]|nr:hypothetical protein [Candidatus Aenigmarchaeota archaeon]